MKKMTSRGSKKRAIKRKIAQIKVAAKSKIVAKTKKVIKKVGKQVRRVARRATKNKSKGTKTKGGRGKHAKKGSPQAHDAKMHADMKAHGKRTDAPSSRPAKPVPAAKTSV